MNNEKNSGRSAGSKYTFVDVSFSSLHHADSYPLGSSLYAVVMRQGNQFHIAKEQDPLMFIARIKDIGTVSNEGKPSKPWGSIPSLSVQT